MDEMHTRTRQNEETRNERRAENGIDEANVSYIAKMEGVTSGALQTLLYYEKILSQDLGLEEGRILGTKLIFSFPRSFSVVMV